MTNSPPQKYFRVRNYDDYQHYGKHREGGERWSTPKWIKLHNSVLTDYDFTRLPDHTKFHITAIWLLASQMQNKLPLDPQWIGMRINATEFIDLDALLEGGFIEIIEINQDVNEVSSERLEGVYNNSITDKTRLDKIRSEYEFEGDVIKLTAKDFAQWEKSYPAIPNLRAKLQSLDDWFKCNPDASKNWFHKTSSMLQRDNAENSPKTEAQIENLEDRRKKRGLPVSNQ